MLQLRACSISCNLKTPPTTTMAAWATAAGVSIHTLSGVINDTAGMPEATRERVRLVIKDRGSHLSTHRAVTEAPG
jgi:hypothetical protein